VSGFVGVRGGGDGGGGGDIFFNLSRYFYN
jgi:hypothetical protein